MKKIRMNKVLKIGMACFMVATFANPMSVFAEDAMTKDGSTETTEEVNVPSIDNFKSLSFLYGHGDIYGAKDVIRVEMDNYDHSDILDQYYTFEWTLGDKFEKAEDQSEADVNSKYVVVANALGTSSISLKITSRTDPTITKTLAKEFNITKTRGSFDGTVEKFNLEEILSNMKSGNYEGYIIYANTDLNPIMPKEIFAAAKENGIDLHISINKGIRGDSMKDSKSHVIFMLKSADINNVDVDFDLRVSTEVANEAVDMAFADKVKPLVIDFSQNGAVPGKMQVLLTINEYYNSVLSSVYDWKSPLYLYHINEETNKLENAGTASVGQGDAGYMIQFEISHCSKYVFTETELSEAELNLPTPTTNDSNRQLDDQPNTGV